MRANPTPSAYDGGPVNVYTLEVSLSSGPIRRSFYAENPIISRSIQIRGDQTLEDLHDGIFTAFDREDDNMYEFRLGKASHDRIPTIYVLPSNMLGEKAKRGMITGDVTRTRIDSLELRRDETFSYWFDFEDNWIHDIKVSAIENSTPHGKFPRVISRVGESPSQYLDSEGEEEEFSEDSEWDIMY